VSPIIDAPPIATRGWLHPLPTPVCWDSALRQQIYMGDEGFVERVQALAEPSRTRAREIPKAQRGKGLSLTQA
jgi:hypothetical protein